MRHTTVALPPDLRSRLENAPLDLLALFRSLDQMYTYVLPSQLPRRELRQLYDLDADYAEAMRALDQPPGRLDRRAMLRDTLAALERLPRRLVRFRSLLSPRVQEVLPSFELKVRRSLDPSEGYSMVPGRDPMAPHPKYG